MIAPWTVEAALEAHRDRPTDRRIREALCVDAGSEPMNCVCGGRLAFSDCEGCGLDVPPFRNVFSRYMLGSIARRLW